MKFFYLILLLNIGNIANSQSIKGKSIIEVDKYLHDFSQKEPLEAIQFIDKEIKGLVTQNNSLLVSLLYFRGNSSILVNNFILAHESYTRALDLADKKNYKRIAAIYQGLGILYDDASKYTVSDSCYLVALKIYQNHNDSSGIVDIYNNIAVVEIDRKNYQKAIGILEDALSYSKSNYHSILILNNIGESYLNLDKNEKAKQYYLTAYQLSKSIDLPHVESVMNINLADVYLKINMIDSSSHHINNALVIIQKHNYILLELEVLKIEAEILKAQGDTEKSYIVYQNYMLLNDSINNIEKYNELNDLDEKRLREKQTKELALIETQHKNWGMKVYLFLSLSILIIFIALFFIIKQLKKIKVEKKKAQSFKAKSKNLTDEIKYKDKELENFAHHINIKNELLEELKTKIKNTGDSAIEAKLLINKNLNLEKDKKEFYQKVDQLHDAFFLKLETKYPQLTERDLQFAALLVVGMPSKEISGTLNISLEGVKKARYRIRKKMGLSRKESLTEMLSQV